MLTNHSLITCSSIGFFALMAILPDSLEKIAGRPLTIQRQWESIVVQPATPSSSIKFEQAEYKVSRKGLPRRREGGGTRLG